MNTKLNILLSGPGLIGKKHAELILKSTRSRLAAIVAPLSSENISYAEKCKTSIYPTIQSAISDLSIDAAIVASPNEVHEEQAICLIENGIPTLVEKPLASTITAAESIWSASLINRVPVLVGHHRTYSPHLRVAKEFISSENFGRIVSIQGAALFMKPDSYFKAGPWRTRPGGGPILINLIHEIGIMRYLCGDITSVSSISSNACRMFEVEDSAAICLGFKNGVIGTFILSDCAASNKSWEMTSGENPSYPYFPDADCYHVSGTNGSIDFPTMRVRYYDDSAEPSWWRQFNSSKILSKPIDPLEVQLHHFEDVVLGKDDPIVTAADGLENIKVVDAIHKSISTGMTININ